MSERRGQKGREGVEERAERRRDGEGRRIRERAFFDWSNEYITRSAECSLSNAQGATLWLEEWQKGREGVEQRRFWGDVFFGWSNGEEGREKESVRGLVNGEFYIYS
ncbi:MAG: hypothetical protein KAH23_08020 [Kiritimatiellae bacterium]|nr:hypothetical protein [Kiritimatiellia bacterium]